MHVIKHMLCSCVSKRPTKPTPAEKEDMAQSIISVFPVLKDDTSSGYVSISVVVCVNCNDCHHIFLNKIENGHSQNVLVSEWFSSGSSMQWAIANQRAFSPQW